LYVLTELFRLLKTAHTLTKAEDEYTDKCKHVSKTMSLNLGGKIMQLNALKAEIILHTCLIFVLPLWLPLEYWASMKLPVSLQFLNLGESVGLLGRVISSSQTRLNNISNS
jgi:hypothetical protein